ncbi:hypothetical protein BGZ47_000738 [Haplosporangium gracile]|nr:hypothetical protein BGZ47_000738 [Haplosporangium gracile]
MKADETEKEEQEEEGIVETYGRVQSSQIVEFVAKDYHHLSGKAVEADDRDGDGFNMEVATSVFDDKYLDLLFHWIVRVYKQLLIRVVQDMMLFVFITLTSSPSSSSSSSSSFSSSSSSSSNNNCNSNNCNNYNPTTTTSSTAAAVATFQQTSKTVSQLWKK